MVIISKSTQNTSTRGHQKSPHPLECGEGLVGDWITASLVNRAPVVVVQGRVVRRLVLDVETLELCAPLFGRGPGDYGRAVGGLVLLGDVVNRHVLTGPAENGKRERTGRVLVQHDKHRVLTTRVVQREHVLAVLDALAAHNLNEGVETFGVIRADCLCHASPFPRESPAKPYSEAFMLSGQIHPNTSFTGWRGGKN